MKKKQRIFIDIIISIIVIALMGYHLFGELVHEYMGVIIFIIVLIHQIINVNWYQRIFKGAYTKIRCLYMIVNLLLILAFILTIVSGVSMAKYIGIANDIITSSRQIHMLASGWLFMMMAAHAGIHITQVKKQRYIKYIFFLLVSIGIYVFFKREFIKDIFLLQDYKLLLYGESIWIFLFEYICLFILFMFIGKKLKDMTKKKEGHQTYENKTNIKSHDSHDMFNNHRMSSRDK